MNRIALLGVLPVLAACFFLLGQWTSRALSPRIGAARDPESKGRMGYYDPAAPCGPVSASLSARLVGMDLELHEAKTLVPFDEKGQTTAIQLIGGLKRVGLVAKAFRFSAVPNLVPSTPMIVHINGDHWAVVAANDQEQVLLDPPNDPASFADKVQFWDGFAIVVSRSEEGMEYLVNDAGR